MERTTGGEEMIREKVTYRVIMEDEVYEELVEAIAKSDVSLFIKILVDFYDKNKTDEIEMPKCMLLKDYLRFHVVGDNSGDKVVSRENGQAVYLSVNRYESSNYMEDFVRNCSRGYYLYKDRIFELKNSCRWTYDADGYYEYFPYLEELASLSDIVRIEE